MRKTILEEHDLVLLLLTAPRKLSPGFAKVSVHLTRVANIRNKTTQFNVLNVPDNAMNFLENLRTYGQVEFQLGDGASILGFIGDKITTNIPEDLLDFATVPTPPSSILIQSQGSVRGDGSL